jgi:thyrotropin-releasing hormone receptor
MTSDLHDRFIFRRYIAICHPILAQKVCTVSRARRIIALTWLFVGIYCTPWLALTSTKPLRLAYQPEMEKCDYTLSRDQYLPLFLIDVIIFYVLPLLISVVLYTRMGFTLHQSVQALRHTHKGSPASPSTCSSPNWAGSTAKSKAKYCVPQRDSTDSIESTRLHGGTAFSNGSNCITSKRTENLQTSVMKSRCQVVKMLIIVVACFAVLWLPYRGLLVYNSVVAKPWQEMWYVDQSLNNRSNVSLCLIIYPFLLTSRYMLFAKTAVVSVKSSTERQKTLHLIE